MGSVCVLTLAGYPLDETKGDPPDQWLSLFAASDFNRERRARSHRNPLVWGEPRDGDRGVYETIYEYRAPVWAVRDRLDLLGFTMATFDANYRKTHQLESKSHRGSSDPYILRGIGPRKALKLTGELVQRKIPKWKRDDVPGLSRQELHILESDDYPFGLPLSDYRLLIRGLMEYVPSTEDVVLELSDQVHAGYYDLKTARDMVLQRRIRDERIVVLTEGKTDTQVLSSAVRLLYPHLADCFVWPDLTARVMGGTSGLVHTLKALLSVGVKAPLLALFDNDAEGKRALAELRSLHLPSTVRAATYPDIESARAWPSAQPSGIQTSDLNGTGCSIELYFGADVLGTGDGRPLVQWSRDTGSGAWQGAIAGKDALKKKFLEKETASTPQALVGDWDDMRALVRTMLLPVSEWQRR